jgi:hypothetical protein
MGNVLATVNLKTGSRSACVFLGCTKTLGTLGLDYFEAGYQQLQRLMTDEAVVHRGVYVQDDPGLRAMVMVGGLDAPYEALAKLMNTANIRKDSLKSNDLMEFLGLDD